MDTTYWQRQTAEQPLFPEIEWSRPETKARGGRLLIVGGNHHTFRRVAEAFEAAQENAVGDIKVAVPDALESVLSQLVPHNAVYLKSNASGGIGLEAQDQLLSYSSWANAVLMAGDIGRNSETPRVLDAFINRYDGQLTLTADAADVVSFSYQALFERENTHFVISIAQLQNLFKQTSQPTAITSTMGVVKLVEALHDFTEAQPIAVTVFYEGKVITSFDGAVATTPRSWSPEDPSWRVPLASKQAAYWMQHSEVSFKALTAAHF